MAPATRRGYQASYLRWLSILGSKTDLQAISREHIARFVADRLKAGAGTPAIRQDLAFLSSLLSHSQLLPGGPERNVVRDYPRKHLAPPATRERFLSLPEITTLLSHLKGIHKVIVLAALQTGMRKSEVLPLKRAEVRLDRRVILLSAARTKTRTGRAVPISPALHEALSELPHTSEFFFPNPATGLPYYDPQPWFPKACALAGLDDFRFHDLRHTFASLWVQRGGALRTLQDILGHKSAQTTRRYAHLDGQHVFREFDRVWNSE
jgi:integrase/recombinase XerD